MKQRKWLFYITLISLLLGILICYRLSNLLGDEQVTELSSDEEYYAINPDTILDKLTQGNTDVFTPLESTPEATSITTSKPVQWSQTDYVRIEMALQKLVWGKPLEDWNFEKALFRLDCAEASSGPQRAYFTYFKIVQSSERESLIERELWIEPYKNSASWHEVVYSPNVWDQQSIDSSRIIIPVEEALKIAEQNGGFEARSAVKDDCVIYLLLAPGSKYGDWQVWYSEGKITFLFEINIDSFTGNYHIVSSKTK